MRKDGVSEHRRHLCYFDSGMYFPEKALKNTCSPFFPCMSWSLTRERCSGLHSCQLLSWLDFKVCFLALHSHASFSVWSLPHPLPSCLTFYVHFWTHSGFPWRNAFFHLLIYSLLFTSWNLMEFVFISVNLMDGWWQSACFKIAAHWYKGAKITWILDNRFTCLSKM